MVVRIYQTIDRVTKDDRFSALRIANENTINVINRESLFYLVFGLIVYLKLAEEISVLTAYLKCLLAYNTVIPGHAIL